jgi:hypothetical protein
MITVLVAHLDGRKAIHLSIDDDPLVVGREGDGRRVTRRGEPLLDGYDRDGHRRCVGGVSAAIKSAAAKASAASGSALLRCAIIPQSSIGLP